LDGNDCDEKKLGDKDLVYRFLDDLPTSIKMVKMIKPVVKSWLDKGSVVEGVSGIIMIAESHLSVHTFPDQKRVYADIFSCRPYDVKKVVTHFKKTFGVKKLKFKIVRHHEGIINR
jgi:S-adenosylmethionine decarboxylase